MDHTSLTKDDKTYYHIEHGKRLWTAEGVEAVIERFKDASVSMGALAIEFKTTVGSIAGLLSRARERKLLSQPVNRKPKLVVKKEKPAKKIKLDPTTLKLNKIWDETPVKRVRLKIVEVPTAVTLEDLKSTQCKYPLGDPKQSDFRYCGAKRDGASPYCKEHDTIAFQRHK